MKSHWEIIEFDLNILEIFANEEYVYMLTCCISMAHLRAVNIPCQINQQENILSLKFNIIID